MISAQMTDSIEKWSSDPSRRSEGILVSRAKSGSHEAFVSLCEPSSKRAFNAICRILNNREDSDDVLQDTLLRAFLHINEFHGDSRFATWLTRIGINSALMHVRKCRHRQISIDSGNETGEGSREWVMIDPSPSPEEQVISNEVARRLRAAISNLPYEFRSVVENRHEHDQPLKDTAASLRISLPAVKSRLMRARRRLYKSLTY